MGTPLVEKYEKILESEKMPFLAKDKSKSSMAIILENTQKEISLSENTLTTDVAMFQPIILPLARRTQPLQVSNLLLGTQPLQTPSGLFYFLKFVYTGKGKDATDRYGNRIKPENYGQILEIPDTKAKEGDTITKDGVEVNVVYVEDDFVLVDQKLFSAGEDFNGETILHTFSNELGFRKILKNYTGTLPTEEGEVLGYNTPEIGFMIASETAKAETRKLRAKYSVEVYQDLKAVHGLVADNELMDMMTSEVLNEIDRECITKVNSWCAPTADFRIAGSNASGSIRYEMEGMAHIGIKIANEAREISRLTRRGAGNVILASPKVCTILEQLQGFKPIQNDSTVDAKNCGVTNVIGTFNNTMTVIMDSFATKEYCTVLYKGDDMDAIGFYCPYVPITFFRVLDQDTTQPSISLMMRYAMIENPQNKEENIYGRTFDVIIDETSVLA